MKSNVGIVSRGRQCEAWVGVKNFGEWVEKEHVILRDWEKIG